MGIPVDSILNAVKIGASVRGETEVPVRVAVYVDSTAVSYTHLTLPTILRV